MTDVKFGGFASYTAHLYNSFKLKGHSPFIFKVRKKGGLRSKFVEDLPAYSITEKEVLNICSSNSWMPIVTCAYWKHNSNAIQVLLESGAALVLHDPTEFNNNLIELAKSCDTKVVVIRKTNVKNLNDLGINPVFIKHPYVRANENTTPFRKRKVAASVSRIDFDKHIDIILKANNDLSEPIDIYGFINRLYAYHKLDKDYDGWRSNYKGQFAATKNSSFNILKDYKVTVDMSAIKMDGGGTQYTFLEAIDAGCCLILNKSWNEGITNSLWVDKKNCLMVSDNEELTKVLKNINKPSTPLQELIKQSECILKDHSPKKIITKFEKLV